MAEPAAPTEIATAAAVPSNQCLAFLITSSELPVPNAALIATPTKTTAKYRSGLPACCLSGYFSFLRNLNQD